MVMRMTVDIGDWSKWINISLNWLDKGKNSQNKELGWGVLRRAGGRNSLMGALFPFSLSYGYLCIGNHMIAQALGDTR